MKMHQETILASYSISACGPGEVQVAAPATGTSAPSERLKLLTNSFLVTAQTLVCEWVEGGFDRLTAGHFSAILDLRPELVLFGSGTTFRFPSPELLAPLYAQGIGVEVMDTAAACRTFNVLVAEGRGVAAAILVE